MKSIFQQYCLWCEEVCWSKNSLVVTAHKILHWFLYYCAQVCVTNENLAVVWLSNSLMVTKKRITVSIDGLLLRWYQSYEEVRWANGSLIKILVTNIKSEITAYIQDIGPVHSIHLTVLIQFWWHLIGR